MINQVTQQQVEPLYILNPKATPDILTDGLNEHLSKLESLTHLAMCDDLPDYPKIIVYHYLWVLSDTVKQVREIFDAIAVKQK
jgi:hypothetical protein